MKLAGQGHGRIGSPGGGPDGGSETAKQNERKEQKRSPQLETYVLGHLTNDYQRSKSVASLILGKELAGNKNQRYSLMGDLTGETTFAAQASS
jgi:hypothetical protein